MAVIKCKMCGGDLEVFDSNTIAECEYCGTKQTVPKVDNEKKITLFSRANRLRFNCEFDKAAGIYESIIGEFPEEAEAYWGLILCKYGIEYVDDPITAKKIPTCHRSSFESVLEDKDFEMVMEYSDIVSRAVYREEAKAIEELRKNIIEVSGKEQPYDIFICYKETTDSGERTLDSVLAQDVYTALTEKGYRVFFSRITLEDKLGQEYEPYIFAALNSAKVMLAFGTNYEYYNAVWVKNEWSRYLQLMAKDKSKHLIPCYKDIDAYDIPKEFAKLQAQDLGKVGAIQDLLRGIEKVLGKKENEEPKTVQVVQSGGVTVDSLLKRAHLFLEDRDWKSAKEYFDKALDINPEYGKAYWGYVFLYYTVSNNKELEAKLSVERYEKNKTFKTYFAGTEEQRKKFHEEKKQLVNEYSLPPYIERERVQQSLNFSLGYQSEKEYWQQCFTKIKNDFQDNKNFIRAEQYADPNFKIEIERVKKAIFEGYENIIAKSENEDGQTDEKLLAKYEKFVEMKKAELAKRLEQAKQRREEDYQTAVGLFENGEWEKAKTLFESDKISTYKSSAEYMNRCEEEIQKIENAIREENKKRREEEEKRKDRIAAEEEAEIEREKRKLIRNIIIGVAVVAGIIFAFWFSNQSKLQKEYEKAEQLYADGNYEEARVAFGKISGYKDAFKRSYELWEPDLCNNTIEASNSHVVGLKEDGTVVAVGENNNGQCNVSEWRNIIDIAVGGNRTVAVHEDGTVVYTADIDAYGHTSLAHWENIVSVYSINLMQDYFVGLKADGTIVTTKEGWTLSEWTDLVKIEDDGKYGLKADGTIALINENARVNYMEELSEWEDIVDVVFTDNGDIYGLVEDGTVIYRRFYDGKNYILESSYLDVETWRDCEFFLTPENEIFATGSVEESWKYQNGHYADTEGYLEDKYAREYIQEVLNWEHVEDLTVLNIYYEDATGEYIDCPIFIGLKQDGTVVAEGPNLYGHLQASEWTNIKIPNQRVTLD